MNAFFDDNLLLNNACGKELYKSVRALSIIDYHSHLDQYAIAENRKTDNIGELWLARDHYKWRVMRMCGVDENLITGDADWRDKFRAYAATLPMLAGNPLYYWTHLELKIVFGINESLSADNADEIYDKANAVLSGMTVGALLEKFGVEYIATTDDPTSDLSAHGRHGSVLVAPTFRADNVLKCEDSYVSRLAEAAGCKTDDLDDYLGAITNRLDYFVSHGCKIADQSFSDFPPRYADKKRAEFLFAHRRELSDSEKEELLGFLLVWLSKEYKKRGMLMQLHFAVTRNVNPEIYAEKGVDMGCDVPTDGVCEKSLIAFLSALGEAERPDIVLYSLNPNDVAMLAAISGAFRRVRMGAAWWFNDTVCGIRDNLSKIAEYACLGTNLGMLTDSRSFTSYARFDFFRRILCDYVGGMVERGEYSREAAETLVRNICYNNIKTQLGI